jgi:DNA-binding PadR family transcriptional regulator
MREKRGMSHIEQIIAQLLRTHRRAYGRELIELSGGALRIGTVYVTLQRMQEAGFITSQAETTLERAKRFYTLTEYGRAVLSAEEMRIRHLQKKLGSIQ